MADLDTFRNVIPYILKHFHVIAIWREFMGWCGDGGGGLCLFYCRAGVGGGVC